MEKYTFLDDNDRQFLKKINSIEINNNEKDDYEECFICCSKLNIIKTILSCNHKFHNKCIDTWFKQKGINECPVCKTVSS